MEVRAIGIAAPMTHAGGGERYAATDRQVEGIEARLQGEAARLCFPISLIRLNDSQSTLP